MAYQPIREQTILTKSKPAKTKTTKYTYMRSYCISRDYIGLRRSVASARQSFRV